MSCVTPASRELKTLAAVKFPGFEEEVCSIDTYSESECDLEDSNRGTCTCTYICEYNNTHGTYMYVYVDSMCVRQRCAEDLLEVYACMYMYIHVRIYMYMTHVGEGVVIYNCLK